MKYLFTFVMTIVGLFVGTAIGIMYMALNYSMQEADEALFFDGDYVPEEPDFEEQPAEAEPEYRELTAEDWEVIDGICGSIGD